MNSIRELVENFKISGIYNGRILFDEQMAPHTTFKIGGPAPVYFEPADTEALINTLLFLKEKNLPYFILGGGSNTVISDDGFDGAVISTSSINFVRKVSGTALQEAEEADSCRETDSVYVECGAGASVAAFVNYCTANVLSGAEKFSGLPGSVGGALYMNARCFEASFSGLFVSAEYIDMPSCEIKRCVFNSAEWAYKVSPFQNTERIITSAVFRTAQCSASRKDSIAAECSRYLKERVSKGHFRYPSAGSVFRNNRDFGKPSGKIIDEAGLRGFQSGGAQIAPWHGNFIINRNHATQKDVKNLVNYIVNIVRAETGFELQPEIIFCGKN